MDVVKPTESLIKKAGRNGLRNMFKFLEVTRGMLNIKLCLAKSPFFKPPVSIFY